MYTAAGLSSAHWPQSRSANSKVARASSHSHYDRSITAALTTRLKSRNLPTLTYQIAALCNTAKMPDVSAPTEIRRGKRANANANAPQVKRWVKIITHQKPKYVPVPVPVPAPTYHTRLHSLRPRRARRQALLRAHG